jgi:GTP-binding protein
MNATFVMSCSGLRQLPQASFPEVAFAGRSNVGKSSLMNAILDRKNLVKTGKTPGKTRLLNYFNINEKLFFVDLPGYGYAAVSKKERAEWGKLMSGYFAARRNLAMCLVLADIRRDLQEEEFSLLELLRQNNISSCLVLTKSDKLSGNQLMNRKSAIAKQAGVSIDELVHFSAITKDGKDKVRQAIADGTGVDWF